MAEKTNANIWEQKVLTLEAKVREKDEALQATESKLAAAEDVVNTLQGRVGALETAAKAQAEAAESRRMADAEAYIASIKSESVKHNAPISEEDLEQVRKCFKANHDDTAKILGNAFLEKARAIGSASTRSTSETHALDANTSDADWLAREREETVKRNKLKGA